MEISSSQHIQGCYWSKNNSEFFIESEVSNDPKETILGSN